MKFMMRFYIVLFITINILPACKNKADIASNSEKQSQDSLQKAKWEKLSDIANKTGYMAGIDTLHFRFSFQFQNFIKINNNILLNKFRIQDIEKSDTSYLLSIYAGAVPRLYFELKCSEEQLKLLLPEAFNSTLRTRPLLIGRIIGIKITTVKKVMFKIETNENGDQNEPDIDMSLDASGNFMFKGELIYVSNDQ